MRNIPLIGELEPGQAPERVRVHRNLNKTGPNGEIVWSVVDPVTGLVCAHVYRVALLDARMRVQPGGRARVLIERQKNVHAYIEGTPADYDGALPIPVTYDPYAAAYFFEVGTRLPVWSAPAAALDGSGASVVLKGRSES